MSFTSRAPPCMVLTVMSTTKIAMLHSELPRVRKLVNDS